MHKTVLQYRIARIFKRGVALRNPVTSQEGWLPAAEWSYLSTDWEKDRLLLRAGQTLEVVAWGRSLEDDSPAFSRRRVLFDPWDSVDESWLGSVRSFRVVRLTKSFAFGEIQPGLEAKIELDDFATYLRALDDKELWLSHQWIGLEDTVAGVVAQISKPGPGTLEPEILLDARELLERLEIEPDFLAGRAVSQRPGEGLHPTVRTLESCSFNATVEHILIVDNDRAFTVGTSALLRQVGFDVTECLSESEALESISLMDVDVPSVAIVDLHLTPELSVHNGLTIARALSARHSRCKVLFVTGEYFETMAEPRLLAKAEEAGDLEVSGYLVKPFTFAQLTNEIGAAAVATPRRLVDIINEQILHESVPERAPTVPVAKPPWRHSIDEAIEELGGKLKGVVVHAFEMHPLNGAGRSLAHYGEGLDWVSIRHKLSKSPVHDTAVHGRREAWVDHDIEKSPRLQGRHFWLRKVLQYRSALGIPVFASSPMGYCLLAFHRKAGIFNEEFVTEAKLCAERCARALEWHWLMEQSEQRARFEAAGMAFACLGHEMRSILIGLDADATRLQHSLEVTSRSGQGVHHILESLKLGTARAIGIAQNFRSIQTPAGTEEFDVLECLREAIMAARTQLVSPGAVEIREFDNPRHAQAFIRADRSSILIALFNLLLNAAQQIELYVREMGIVWIEWRIPFDGRLEIDIKDTGPGIHRCDFTRVFEVGYSTKPQGTGMGLYICRQALRSVGSGAGRGDVRLVESILNLGSTFRVSLPYERIREPQEQR